MSSKQSMIANTEQLEALDIVTEKSIRMLEQLNRTLELLQVGKPIEAATPDRPPKRQATEEAVLTCIQILCTPMVQRKRSSV